MPLLSMAGMAKSFPGVVALDGVDLDLEPGEIHALLGENGAGKSTLMKILGGVHQPDRGEMTLRGEPYRPTSPHQAQAHRIGFIHQELNLAENMTVAENVFLGRYPGRGGFIDHAALRANTERLTQALGLRVDVDSPVRPLNVGHRQLVEIARALSFDADVLIMDEPTAALTDEESRHLFEVVKRLRAQNKAIVYISHRMDEVFSLSDRITVLRDGRSVATFKTSERSPQEAIRLMVGRDPGQQFPPREPSFGAVVLRVEGLQREGVLHDVSFSVRAGEIVGLAGLIGAGRTEIARAILGADPLDSGAIYVEEQPMPAPTPAEAIRHRLAYTPEDRKTQGLLLARSVEENVNIANLPDGLLPLQHLRDIASHWVEGLKIRTRDIDQQVKALSGGNQQKVLFGRWLARGCKVLILDEPTRGVDIGARAEMYKVIFDLAQQGVGILLISSDLPELMGLSDTILVIREGCVSGRFDRNNATPEAIMTCAVPT